MLFDSATLRSSEPQVNWPVQVTDEGEHRSRWIENIWLWSGNESSSVSFYVRWPFLVAGVHTTWRERKKKHLSAAVVHSLVKTSHSSVGSALERDQPPVTDTTYWICIHSLGTAAMAFLPPYARELARVPGWPFYSAQHCHVTVLTKSINIQQFRNALCAGDSPTPVYYRWPR